MGRRRGSDPAPNPYAAQTYASRLAIRRFTHRRRQRTAWLLAPPPRDARVLDFGCGDGRFAVELARERPDLTVFAWDPQKQDLVRAAADAAGVEIEIPATLSAVPPTSIDLIYCQEVLEHLPDPLLARELEAIERLLRPQCTLLVSVPVEIGPAALVKGAVRAAASRRYPQTLASVARATLGLPVRDRERRLQTSGFAADHAGFDHRRLLRTLERAGWQLERRRSSPFPLLPSGLNAQVVWRLVRVR